MMYKWLGISSMIIGFVTLLSITHFNLRFVELQSQSETIDYFVYGRTNKKILYFTVLSGIAFALISFQKKKDKIAIIGLVTCLVGFLRLVTHPY